MIPSKKKALKAFMDTVQTLDGNLSFAEICRRSGISPVDMDEILIEEMGIDGRSVVEALGKPA